MVCGIRETQLHKAGFRGVQDWLCDKNHGMWIRAGLAVGCRGGWLETAYMFISAAKRFAGKVEMLLCLKYSNTVLHFNLF